MLDQHHHVGADQWLDLRKELHAVHSARACALKIARRVRWRLNRERIENPSQRIVDGERMALQEMMLESVER
jgi:regulator of sigma D